MYNDISIPIYHKPVFTECFESCIPNMKRTGVYTCSICGRTIGYFNPLAYGFQKDRDTCDCGAKILWKLAV